MEEKEVSKLEKRIQTRLEIDQLYSKLIEPLGPAIVSIPKMIEITRVYIDNLISNVDKYTSLIT